MQHLSCWWWYKPAVHHATGSGMQHGQFWLMQVMAAIREHCKQKSASNAGFGRVHTPCISQGVLDTGQAGSVNTSTCTRR